MIYLTEEQTDNMSTRQLSAWIKKNLGIRAGNIILDDCGGRSRDPNLSQWWVLISDTDTKFNVKQTTCGPWDDYSYVVSIVRRMAYIELATGKVVVN